MSLSLVNFIESFFCWLLIFTFKTWVWNVVWRDSPKKLVFLLFVYFFFLCSLLPSIINYAFPNSRTNMSSATDVYTAARVWTLNASFNKFYIVHQYTFSVHLMAIAVCFGCSYRSSKCTIHVNWASLLEQDRLSLPPVLWCFVKWLFVFYVPFHLTSAYYFGVFNIFMD